MCYSSYAACPSCGHWQLMTYFILQLYLGTFAFFSFSTRQLISEINANLDVKCLHALYNECLKSIIIIDPPQYASSVDNFKGRNVLDTLSIN